MGTCATHGLLTDSLDGGECIVCLRALLAAAERERDEERAWRKVAQAGCAANEADFMRAEARFFAEVREKAAEKAQADAADRCWREAEAALATERIAGPQHPDALTDPESKYHHACKRAAAADADVARLTAERDEAMGHARQLQADIEGEQAGAMSFRTRAGAREDETFIALLDRLLAERDAARAAHAQVSRERDELGRFHAEAEHTLAAVRAERDAALAMVAVLEGYCLGHKARVAVLEGALRFYATANDAKWMGDSGETARAALGGERGDVSGAA